MTNWKSENELKGERWGRREGANSQRLSGGEASQGAWEAGKVNRNQHELNCKVGKECISRKNWLQIGKRDKAWKVS